MPPDRPRRVVIDAAPQRRAELLAQLDAVQTDAAAAEVAIRDFDDAAALARAISEGWAGAPAVVLVDDLDGALAFAALRAGAAAVIARDVSARELRVAVEAVALGFAVLGDDARAALAARSTGEVAFEALTAREREVLDLLARGWSNHRIAERLGVSDHTVKAHVGAILAKLGAATRTEAVTTGARLGLVML